MLLVSVGCREVPSLGARHLPNPWSSPARLERRWVFYFVSVYANVQVQSIKEPRSGSSKANA